MLNKIVLQNSTKVNSIAPLQSHSERADILALADHALTQANRHKAEWLATGNLAAWRLWQAAEADRRMLLGEAASDG